MTAVFLADLPKPLKPGDSVIAVRNMMAIDGYTVILADTHGAVLEAPVKPGRYGKYHIQWPDNAHGWHYAEDLYIEREEKGKPSGYSGSALPRWVVVGARVKVKATPELRRYGIRTHGAFSALDTHAFSGDQGAVIKVGPHDGWSYAVEFSRGRTYSLRNPSDLENLTRVK